MLFERVFFEIMLFEKVIHEIKKCMVGEALNFLKNAAEIKKLSMEETPERRFSCPGTICIFASVGSKFVGIKFVGSKFVGCVFYWKHWFCGS